MITLDAAQAGRRVALSASIRWDKPAREADEFASLAKWLD